jgi:hypothetical protein
MKFYTQYKNVLGQEELQTTFDALLVDPGWSFHGRSVDDGFTFWYKHLTDNKFFSEYMFEKVRALTGKNFDIERIYANGQSHGMPGSLHQDNPANNAYTFLYYANPRWDITWGGETVFYENNQEYGSVLYVPNSAILFKGSLFHAGLEPTRHMSGLRVTVAFKLLEI